MDKSEGSRLIPLSDPKRWARALETVEHAFAHTWAYCRAIQLTTGLPTFLYHEVSEGANVVCPIALRPIQEWQDIVTPPGFSGFAGAPSPGFLERWALFARDQGWVCGFIGLHPLFAPRACYHDSDYAAYNQLFVLDLRREEDELAARLSENRRRQIRAAARNRNWIVEDRERLSAFFLGHVNEFLVERGASEAAIFGEATLRAILEDERTLLVGGG